MLLVNIDGVDGSGKSTLVDNLIKHYQNQDKKITFFHFPRYDTEIGSIIKRVLTDDLIQIDPAAFQMLCSADRVNWSQYDLPKLKKEYDIILVDRHTTSALVYGSIDGVSKKEILNNDNKIAQPDINLVLLTDVETSLERMANRDEKSTKYENAEHIEKATKEYLELRYLIPNIHYINANQRKDDVLNESIEIIDNVLKEGHLSSQNYS